MRPSPDEFHLGFLFLLLDIAALSLMKSSSFFLYITFCQKRDFYSLFFVFLPSNLVSLNLALNLNDEENISLCLVVLVFSDAVICQRPKRDAVRLSLCLSEKWRIGRLSE